jgi:hypothetical protein
VTTNKIISVFFASPKLVEEYIGIQSDNDTGITLPRCLASSTNVKTAKAEFIKRVTQAYGSKIRLAVE